MLATDAPAPMVPRRFRVASNVPETADTVTLALEPVDGAPFDTTPGRFHMLYAFGVGEVPISVSGHRDGRVLHTVRDVGAVSRALCGLAEGAMVGVRGPYGTGWDLDAAAGRDVVIVAGGIGLAPLRPAVETVTADRSRFGRVALLIGARTPDLLLFPDDVRDWRSRFDLQVEVTVDAAGPAWRGDVGLVTELIDRVPFTPGTTTALVCGPEVMMRHTAAALVDRGVPAAHVQLSMERNMKCGVGHCGHCQFGPAFVCTDGPVFPFERLAPLLATREL